MGGNASSFAPQNKGGLYVFLRSKTYQFHGLSLVKIQMARSQARIRTIRAKSRHLNLKELTFGGRAAAPPMGLSLVTYDLTSCEKPKI